MCSESLSHEVQKLEYTLMSTFAKSHLVHFMTVRVKINKLAHGQQIYCTLSVRDQL